MSSASEPPPPYGEYPHRRPVQPAPIPGRMARALPAAPAGADDEETDAETIRRTPLPGAGGPGGYPPPAGYQAATGGYPGMTVAQGGYQGMPGGPSGAQGTDGRFASAPTMQPGGQAQGWPGTRMPGGYAGQQAGGPGGPGGGPGFGPAEGTPGRPQWGPDGYQGQQPPAGYPGQPPAGYAGQGYAGQGYAGQ